MHLKAEEIYLNEILYCAEPAVALKNLQHEIQEKWFVRAGRLTKTTGAVGHIFQQIRQVVDTHIVSVV